MKIMNKFYGSTLHFGLSGSWENLFFDSGVQSITQNVSSDFNHITF